MAFSVFLAGYNLFFYHQLTGFAYPICIFLLNLTFYLTKASNHHPYAKFFSLIAVTLSVFTAIFDHSTNNYLNYPLSILATILSWLTYHDSLPVFPINLSNLFSKLPRLRFQTIRPEGNFQHLWKHLLPGFLGLVFGLTLINLLNFADPIFKHSTQFLFDFLKQNFVQRLVSTLFVSLYISPLLFLYFLPLKYPENRLGQSKSLFELFSQWASLFGSIIYSTFLIIQLNYLIFHHNPNIPGFTYSAYVKAGFAELILASVLTLIVAQIKKTKLSSLLSFLTVGLLFLNAYKLFLYVQFNGLTRSRILGAWFLIWLFALLFIQLFRHHLFSKLLIPTTFFILVLLNLLPTDNLLLYTLPPKVNGQIDYCYLVSKLDTNSSSLWPGLIAKNTQGLEDVIAKIDPKKITKTQFYDLYWQMVTLEEIERISWGLTPYQENITSKPSISWPYKNLSKAFTYNSLTNISDIQKSIDETRTRFNDYYNAIPENISQQYMQQTRDRSCW